jgi:hypothetical protein
MHLDMESVIHVRLHHQRYPVAVCQASYVGLLGMQLVARTSRYPLGTRVEVELLVDDEEDMNCCRVPAVVTNQGKHELGISFLQHDMDTNTQLLNIIACAQRRAAALAEQQAG